MFSPSFSHLTMHDPFQRDTVHTAAQIQQPIQELIERVRAGLGLGEGQPLVLTERTGLITGGPISEELARDIEELKQRLFSGTPVTSPQSSDREGGSSPLTSPYSHRKGLPSREQPRGHSPSSPRGRGYHNPSVHEHRSIERQFEMMRELQEQNELLRQQNRELQDQLGGLRQQTSELGVHHERQIAALSHKLDEMAHQLQLSPDTLETFRRQNEHIQAQEKRIEELEAHRAHLVSEMEAQEERHASQLQAYQKEIHATQRLLRQKEDELAALQHRHGRLERAYDDLNREHRDLLQAHEELRTVAGAQSERLEEQAQLLEHQQSMIETQAQGLEEALALVDQHKAQIRDQAHEIGQLREALQEKTELAERQAELITALRDKNQRLSSLVRQGHEWIGQASDALQQKDREVQELTTQREHLLGLLQGQDERIQSLEEHLAQAKGNVEELTEERDHLLQQAHAQSEHIEALEHDLAEAREGYSSLRQTAAAIISDKDREIQSQDARIHRLEDHIEAISQKAKEDLAAAGREIEELRAAKDEELAGKDEQIQALLTTQKAIIRRAKQEKASAAREIQGLRAASKKAKQASGRERLSSILDLHNQVQERGALRARVKELESTLREEQLKSAFLQRRAELAGHSLSEARAQLQATRGDLEQERLKSAELERQALGAERNLEEAQSQLAASEEENAQLKERVQTLLQEAVANQEEIASLSGRLAYSEHDARAQKDFFAAEKEMHDLTLKQLDDMVPKEHLEHMKRRAAEEMTRANRLERRVQELEALFSRMGGMLGSRPAAPGRKKVSRDHAKSSAPGGRGSRSAGSGLADELGDLLEEAGSASKRSEELEALLAAKEEESNQYREQLGALELSLAQAVGGLELAAGDSSETNIDTLVQEIRDLRERTTELQANLEETRAELEEAKLNEATPEEIERLQGIIIEQQAQLSKFDEEYQVQGALVIALKQELRKTTLGAESRERSLRKCLDEAREELHAMRGAARELYGTMTSIEAEESVDDDDIIRNSAQLLRIMLAEYRGTLTKLRDLEEQVRASSPREPSEYELKAMELSEALAKSSQVRAEALAAQRKVHVDRKRLRELEDERAHFEEERAHHAKQMDRKNQETAALKEVVAQLKGSQDKDLLARLGAAEEALSQLKAKDKEYTRIDRMMRDQFKAAETAEADYQRALFNLQSGGKEKARREARAHYQGQIEALQSEAKDLKGKLEALRSAEASESRRRHDFSETRKRLEERYAEKISAKQRELEKLQDTNRGRELAYEKLLRQQSGYISEIAQLKEATRETEQLRSLLRAAEERNQELSHYQEEAGRANQKVLALEAEFRRLGEEAQRILRETTGPSSAEKDKQLDPHGLITHLATNLARISEKLEKEKKSTGAAYRRITKLEQDLETLQQRNEELLVAMKEKQASIPASKGASSKSAEEIEIEVRMRIQHETAHLVRKLQEQEDLFRGKVERREQKIEKLKAVLQKAQAAIREQQAKLQKASSASSSDLGVPHEEYMAMVKFLGNAWQRDLERDEDDAD